MSRSTFFVTLHDKVIQNLNDVFTITPDRQKLVGFSDPTVRNVHEVVVHRPATFISRGPSR